MPTEREWIEQAEEYERKMHEENIDLNWQAYLEMKAQACREATCYAEVEVIK